MTAHAASASIRVSTSQFGRRPVARRAAVDDGHARGSARPAVSTATWQRRALEQLRVGQRQHGARVVDGGAGDVVVVAPR